jgi:hypothetical protein
VGTQLSIQENPKNCGRNSFWVQQFADLKTGVDVPDYLLQGVDIFFGVEGDFFVADLDRHRGNRAALDNNPVQ